MTTTVGSSTLLGCVPAMALGGCTAEEGRSSPPPSPASSTHTQTPAATPAPPHRRTTPEDVELVDISVDPALVAAGYRAAYVPVDAWAATRVLRDAGPARVNRVIDAILVDTDDGNDERVIVTERVAACELISVWALPHPGRVVIGWEERPGVQCLRAVEHTIIFVLLRRGENSAGVFDYGDVVPTTLLHRPGSYLSVPND